MSFKMHILTRNVNIVLRNSFHGGGSHLMKINSSFVYNPWKETRGVREGYMEIFPKVKIVTAVCAGVQKISERGGVFLDCDTHKVC